MSNHWLDKELQMWTNDVDFVIAHSKEEAIGFAFDVYGEYSEEDYGYWEVMPKDSFFKFRHDDGHDEEKTIQQFINEHGAGYFACTEY